MEEKRLLLLLNMSSLVYFLCLLLVSGIVTYKGSYMQYSQNDTKFREETVALDNITAIVSLCRLPGFKSGGFSDVETVRHKDDLANDLLQVDDVVQSAVIVVNGRDAGKVVGGSDKFILSLDNWVMVHSGVKYTGTCFSLPLAPIISEFGLNTTDEFSLVLGLKTVEGTQYIVQVYSPGESFLVGILSMQEALIPTVVVRASETAMYSLEVKKTERQRKCRGQVGAADIALDVCLKSYLDTLFPDCTKEAYEAFQCSHEELKNVTRELEAFKLDGYERLTERTGCHFPCTRMHYSLLDGFVVDTSSLQLIQGAHTGITIRKFQTSTMTMFSEVGQYDLYLFITDIGGVWGLFLGLSFWSIHEWGLRPLAKYISSKRAPAGPRRR